MDWVDKFSIRYPDLHIWKKTQRNFLELQEVDQQNKNGPKSEKFEDKYKQLKIYNTIFQRNQGEIKNLIDEF